MIPDEVIEDIDPAEVGLHGCLLPTGDATEVNTTSDDE